MILKFKDVLPNPNRDLVRNPLDENKVNELVDSINETGFWDNVVVRLRPDKKAECAYGHTRIAAAIKAGLIEANFIVKDFDDEMMIKVMGRENSDTYKYSILALLEKVRAVVMGLAEGRVKPFAISTDTNASVICYAPSFVPATPEESPASKLLAGRYTAIHVAQFLGAAIKDGSKFVPDNNIKAALGALRLIQIGQMKESEIRAWTVNELLKAVRERTERHASVLKAEAKKAEIIKQASLTAKQYSDALKKKEEERKTAQKIRDLQYAEERKQALEEEAKCRADKKIQDEKNEKEKAARLKEAERLYERDKDKIAKSSHALKLIEEQRKKKEEIARVGFEKTMREGFARYLSEEDPYVEMQKRGKKSRTDKERQLLKEVLEKIHDRVDFQLKAIQPDIKENK